MIKITSMTRRAWLFAAVGPLSFFSISQITRAEVPEGWKTFKGAYFEIGVPPGFVAKPVKTDGIVNSVSLVNAKEGVEFQIYSPQWGGVAPFAKAGEGEKIDSSDKKVKGKETTEEFTINAKDGSYVRFVLSQSFAGEENGTHTNKTFGIKVPNMEKYTAIKKIYVEWKKTLTQFAD